MPEADPTPVRTAGVALVTVTTPAFVPGTVVLIRSFLAAHPAFEGDIVVLHHGLSRFARERLGALPNTSLRPVSDALLGRVEALVEAVPQKRRARARYHSLDALALDGYDRVLFCDSDLLVRGSVEALFRIDAPLVCCGDGPHYTGRGRDPETFRPAEPNIAHPLRDTFNAGVLLFGAGVPGADLHRRALDLVRPEVVGQADVNDQVIFFRLFDGRQHLVGPEYNFLLGHALQIGLAEGIGLDDARVVHFNRQRKPWALDPGADTPVVRRATAWWREVAEASGVPLPSLP